MIYGNFLLNASCCGWEGRSRLSINQLNLSYGKKARSLEVKYGAWQIELRPDRRPVISAILSGPRARLAENRRVSFSLQFREDFEKDPHVRPVYRSIFQSRGPTPTSFSGLTRGRATGER